MLFKKLKAAAVLALSLASIATAGGLALRAVAQAPAEKTPEPTKERPKGPPPLAWQRTDRYVRPNFEAFFPDDPEGGKRLDALFGAEDRDKRPDAEVLKTVREGLRRTTRHRTLVLAWIGNRFIWGKSPQNPDAVEIMYHAADFRGASADPYGTRHYAVYFGLSVVEPKPSAVLYTLANLCMRVDDPNDLDRIAWGTRSQRDEILAFVRPYLASEDEATRKKAEVVEKILDGRLKAFAWSTEVARERAREKFSGRLPEIKAALRDGPSRERSDALRLIIAERLALIMDESFLPAFAACASDPDAEIRRDVAIIAGDRWIWSARPQDAGAIDLELTLSKDEDRDVRSNAVYYGLSTVTAKPEKVVRRLLEIALEEKTSDLARRIAWGLQEDREEAAKILDGWLKGDDPARAGAAREIYRTMTGQDPPAPPDR